MKIEIFRLRGNNSVCVGAFLLLPTAHARSLEGTLMVKLQEKLKVLIKNKKMNEGEKKLNRERSRVRKFIDGKKGKNK
jgi:hypothetical protein